MRGLAQLFRNMTNMSRAK